jgi:hypothetical protein
MEQEEGQSSRAVLFERAAIARLNFVEVQSIVR